MEQNPSGRRRVVGALVALGLALAGAGVAAAPATAAVGATSVTAVARGAAKVRITKQPSARKVAEGATAKFTVGATKGATVRWQVRRPGTKKYVTVKGANRASYKVRGTTRLDGARYRAVVTKGSAKVVSRSVRLTVVAKPRITTAPASVLVASGATAKFSVRATGPSLRYAWQVQRPDGSWATVKGATSRTYERTARAADSGTQVRVVVRNSAGRATSAAAMLLVRTTPADAAGPGALVPLTSWLVSWTGPLVDVRADAVADGLPDPGEGATYLAGAFVAGHLHGSLLDPVADLQLVYRAVDGTELDVVLVELVDDPELDAMGVTGVVVLVRVPVGHAPGTWTITDTSGPTPVVGHFRLGA